MNATPPSLAGIDQQAKDYLDLKRQVLDAKLALTHLQQKMDAKGEILKEIVAKFGSAHAEKSKLFHGLAYEVMVTFGQSVSIDAAAVENFRLALVAEDQPRLLHRIFEKTIRWTLSPQASEMVRGEKLSTKLKALFAKCQVVKEKTPNMTVREKAIAA